MSIEYRDGMFSENMPLDEAMKQFQEQMLRRHADGKNGFPKALHVGTEEELNEIKGENSLKSEESLQEQIDKLKSEVEALKPTKSGLIYIPTEEEIILLIERAGG